MNIRQRLVQLEQAARSRADSQPPADDEPITLLESLELFRYGYMEPGALGIRTGADGAQHIVVTDSRHADCLTDAALRFDAEWHAAGCRRLVLLTREETEAAIAAIDRGDLEYRPHAYTGSLLWWSHGDDSAAQRVPYMELALIDSTARVLADQGETVCSLADLRALLCEALLCEALGCNALSADSVPTGRAGINGTAQSGTR